MSCWVVPSLAAELWGVSLEHVLGQIRAGTIRSKIDYGFVLIDVAPESQDMTPPVSRRHEPEPTYSKPTYPDPAEWSAHANWSTQSVLTPEELALLHPVDTGWAAVDQPLEPQTVAEPTADELSWLNDVHPAPALELSMAIETPAEPADAESYFASLPPIDFPVDAAFGVVASPIEPRPIESSPVEEPAFVAPRSSRRRRPGRKIAAAPVEVAALIESASDDEHEDGPDPNFGEADDGQPLNWRQARQRAAASRRRPPPIRMAG